MNPLYLSVIIPCYNEEKRIPDTLSKVISYLSQKDYEAEIIIVDDGSRDQTYTVCEPFTKKYPQLQILRHDQNHGKGYAVRTGVLKAQGEYILFSDADLSTPIEEVEKLLAVIKTNHLDIAIGSRSLPGSEILQHQPWYRETMGKTFNKFVQWLVLPGIIDTQCGFKLFSKKAAQDIFPQQKLWGFAFDVELLYIGRQLGYQIVEIPIRWLNSPLSKVNPIKDSLKMLIELQRIKSYHKGLKKINNTGS